MIRKLVPFAIALVLIYMMWLLPAWDQGIEHVPPDTKPSAVQASTLPHNHPPLSQPPASSDVLPPDHPPIPAAGAPGNASMGTAAAAGSMTPPTDLAALTLDEAQATELERALESLPAASRSSFETAFRLTFTTARDARNYALAKVKFNEVLEGTPNHAPCYRGLAYVEFNTTMDATKTIDLYDRALALDPNYGEAHYAMAFMLGTGDRAKGEVHFKRAMELGVADGRNLRERFYSGVR
jgi:hypothetical protein